MKKILIALSLFSLYTASAEQYIINLGNQDNIVVEESTMQNNNSNNSSDNSQPTTYSSCNEILSNNPTFETGNYMIENSGQQYQVYCDMTTHGGGWTLVVVQYEHDPVIDWNEGIQSDYDSDGNVGFALNSSELPSHSQVSFGQEDARSGRFAGNTYFNFIYSTGNIPLTTITSIVSGTDFLLHRDIGGFYHWHNPSTGIYGNEYVWNNSLFVNPVSNDITFAWAFSPQQSTQVARGYAIAGSDRQSINDNGAWMVWVR